MDEELVSELESAIADAGALLVRVQKYRRGAGPEGVALARDALALGDAARRLHRRGRLDALAARRLLGKARDVVDGLRALLVAVHGAAEYRAAVTAHGARDAGALAALLPAVFASLEPAGVTSDLFTSVAWLRRGRLRPVAEVVADVVAARTEGLPAEGDDLSPGADAELPAVALSAEPPGGEPVVLRIPGGTLDVPVHRLADSGEVLVHAPRLAVPHAVVRLADRLDPDEQLRVEVAPVEYDRYREALAAALATAGVPVEPG